jgi:hypothetical protein
MDKTERVQYLDKIAELQAEIERLRAWKEDALRLMKMWDKVWDALGQPQILGEMIPKACEREARRLKEFEVVARRRLLRRHMR